MASIKDLKRMCDSYGDYCTGCPLYNPKKICTPNAIIDNVDEIVDKWVASHHNANTETCVCCGAEIPEGRQVCPACEREDK